jgi:putative sigma-54 modulation protein
MKYEIHGDKLLVTPAIKSYIQEKLGKLTKYFEHPENMTARVVARVRGREQIIEVTIPMHSFTLRNEQADKDLYAAIDLVADKLERQIVKNKVKIQRRDKKVKENEFNFKNIKDEEEPVKESVVKRKKLDTKPMSEEEAIIQMNMLGHDFFIYRDANKNIVNVLYKRKDGNYGIIETTCNKSEE